MRMDMCVGMRREACTSTLRCLLDERLAALPAATDGLLPLALAACAHPPRSPLLDAILWLARWCRLARHHLSVLAWTRLAALVRLAADADLPRPLAVGAVAPVAPPPLAVDRLQPGRARSRLILHRAVGAAALCVPFYNALPSPQALLALTGLACRVFALAPRGPRRLAVLLVIRSARALLAAVADRAPAALRLLRPAARLRLRAVARSGLHLELARSLARSATAVSVAT